MSEKPRISAEEGARRVRTLISDRQRPFTLRERDGHLLIDALDAYLDEAKQARALLPPASSAEQAADERTTARCRSLQDDLREWLGFPRRNA
jgi:hypothetical protein